MMRVEVRDEASFLEQDVQVVLVENNNTPRALADSAIMSSNASSTYCNARDTSQTNRDGDLDDTRQTVNTMSSILNLTEDEDEDDEDELMRSMLFEEMAALTMEDDHAAHQHQHNNTGKKATTRNSPVSVAVPPQSTQEASTLLGTLPSFHAVTDTIVDSFCPGDIASQNDLICTQSLPVCSYTAKNRILVGADILQLLGCTNKPDEEEMDKVWAVRTAQVMKNQQRPTRTSIKERMKKIHRMRMERLVGNNPSSSSSRHGANINGESAAAALFRVRSMVDYMPEPPKPKKSSFFFSEPELGDLIGKGIDPILPSENGYDSDPGDMTYEQEDESALKLVQQEQERLEKIDTTMADQRLHELVQTTLNSIHTLTWHPSKDIQSSENIKTQFLSVNAWIERGTVIQQTGVVVEPVFMWREVYHAELSKHKLNESTQNPWTLRLLDTCRIVEATAATLDRSLYPLVRTNCCFFLRTCSGQEFLFEANSPNERRIVCDRWKLAVARFASFAVTEDVDAIAEEFFHPQSASPMFTGIQDRL